MNKYVRTYRCLGDSGAGLEGLPSRAEVAFFGSRVIKHVQEGSTSRAELAFSFLFFFFLGGGGGCSKTPKSSSKVGSTVTAGCPHRI